MGRSGKASRRGLSRELYTCRKCCGTRSVIRRRNKRAMGHAKTMLCPKCGPASVFFKVV